MLRAVGACLLAVSDFGTLNYLTGLANITPQITVKITGWLLTVSLKRLIRTKVATDKWVLWDLEMSDLVYVQLNA
jgi:hypothetical protein